MLAVRSYIRHAAAGVLPPALRSAQATIGSSDMNGIFTTLERACAALVFVFVEVGIVLRYPKTYWRALRRARAAGVYPFHACPRSMDEKFLWRKTFDRDPCFSRISDKLALRGWLQDSGLDLSMTPVLWAGFSPHALPDEFLTGDVVIKANHDCGTCFMMWRDALPRDILTTKLECALARDYSQYAGEWGYKNIVPRVFAEKRIGRDGIAVNDLKFYTFGRRIERIVHIQDQQGGRFGQVFVPDGEGGFDRLNRAPTVCDGMIDVPLEGVFDRALSLACELGAPFDHMRVDLLEADGELFMTEMTVYNQSGYLTEGGADRNSNVSLAWDIRRSWALRTRPGGLGMRIYLGLLHRAIDRTNPTSDS